ncbi:restriction endonuclease subunit S [Flavobacterium sp. 25HG05S-40]|uniref:restriction endonuclease subunit S n=1 Tax=Flavobacterium sp. 25HG05S-40 TaxID=3458682 RepID=UPI004044122E
MKVKLSDICLMQSGGTPKRSNLTFYNGNIPWITISDFKNASNDIISKTEESLTENGLKAINNRIFKKGTLLLAMYGSVGKTVITGIEASTNQAILAINPKDENVLNIKFLKYWFEHNKDFIYSQGKGATLQNISLSIIERQEIDLPEKDVQDKIVALLDKAKNIIEKREQMITLYDELLSSFFLKTFGDPYFNPKKYKLNTLENLCEFITKGTTPKSEKIFEEYKKDRVPFLKVHHIKDDIISFSNKPSYISKVIHKKELSRSIVKPNDILMNIVGPPLGKIALVPTTFSEWNINQALVIFRVKEEILPSYLLYTIKSNTISQSIIQSAVGVRQQNISLKQCREISIPIPPIKLQKKFDKVFLINNKCKINIIKAKNELSNLLNSLYQKTFNNDFVYDIDIELEALLNNIDLRKSNIENDINTIKTDATFLQRLLDKLNEQEFDDIKTYDKAKYVSFRILNEENGLVIQKLNKDSNNIKLVLK